MNEKAQEAYVARKIAELERVQQRWQKSAEERWNALSDEEREDAEQRASIRRMSSRGKESPREYLERSLAPPKPIPFPRGFGLEANDEDRRELLRETWDEVRARAISPGGLAELESVRTVLRRTIRTHKRKAEQEARTYADSSYLFSTSDVVDEDRRGFALWFRRGIEVPGIKPPAIWWSLTPGTRDALVRARRRIQRHEDVERAARFRLAVIDIVLFRVAMFGTVDTLSNTPEDERPVFEELHPYHMENRLWIVNKYRELRAKYPNESALSVRKRVCEEYNLVFGDRFRPLEETTVRRYIGEKEPR